MLLLRTSRGVDPGIPLLRSLGTSAHVWLPGASGVSVASLPSNNYLLSDFATLAGVDAVVGGVKDGMNPSGGISLTQATTANKPLVRRGTYNQCLWSELLASGFPSTVFATVVGTLLKPTAAAGQHYVSGNVPQTGTPVVTLAVVAKANGYSWMGLTGSNPGLFTSFDLQNGVVGSVAGGVTASMLALGSGKYLCTVTNTYASQGQNIFVEPNSTQASWTPDGVSGIDIFQTGVFLGAWTAAQILAEGGIPTTTATAASNPSAGKYWWHLDGSNDSLLSGNLGITNACTIVIAGRVNSLAATQFLFGEDVTGLAFYIEGTTGIVIASKSGTAQLVNSGGFPATAGVPFVLTFRLSSGTAVIRRNGVQIATAATALTFAATTGGRIGTNFAGTSYPLGGALGWVVALPVALSDADCLTVERLVSSQFPNGPVF